jgi:hypothetical protein
MIATVVAACFEHIDGGDRSAANPPVTAWDKSGGIVRSRSKKD